MLPLSSLAGELVPACTYTHVEEKAFGSATGPDGLPSGTPLCLAATAAVLGAIRLYGNMFVSYVHKHTGYCSTAYHQRLQTLLNRNE